MAKGERVEARVSQRRARMLRRALRKAAAAPIAIARAEAGDSADALVWRES